MSNLIISKEIKKLRSGLTLHYQKITKGSPKRILLLLHGFLQDDEIIYKKFQTILPDDVMILIPRAPFPIMNSFDLENITKYEKKNEQEEKPLVKGFAWYFYDSKKMDYLIDYTFSVNILEELIETSNDQSKKSLPVTLIGYSQGGYLGLFVSAQVQPIDKMIGINCNYRVDLLKEDLREIELHAINGQRDKLVDPINAKKNFDKLKSTTNSHNFYNIENAGHRISDKILEVLKRII